MQMREEKFKAEAAAKAAAEEAARVCPLTPLPPDPAAAFHRAQIAKMTPEELERLKNRCRKFGLPVPGECGCRDAVAAAPSC
jgi:hypothetical protein